MAFNCRLTSGFAAFALVLGSSTLALAQGIKDSAGEHKISRCSSYGSGFVEIEGTDGCARIGGHIRVEMGIGHAPRGGFARSDSADGTRPIGLGSGQNAADPPFDMRADSRGHLRVRELPGSRDIFAR